MSPGLGTALKRTRESTSKVRTGCDTCKVRRVKCDEAKPVCRRCAVGGRKCGYNNANAGPRPRNVVTVYLAPAQLQMQPVFFAKDRGIDYFRQNLAAELEGQFDSNFWSKLVLQLSHSEPSVRHAVSALSVTYQDIKSSLRHPSGQVHANPEAQREWILALRTLSARIQAHPSSNLVPLVCCLVFTCIEFLKGNVNSAMLHVESGLNILAAHDYAVSTLSSRALQDHIVPIFLRLNVLCSLAGRRAPQLCTPAATHDSPLRELTHARRRLIEISDACIRFIAQASLKAPMFRIDVDDLVEQVKLQARLDAWYDQLDELHGRLQQAAANQDALNLLLVQYKVISIWLRVCTSPGEMATDACQSDFEELVHYAEQISKPDVPQPLSFDMQILGPLYYTALSCRHPSIRRRALQMLQLAPRREALWNGRYAYVTARRVIELEERNLNGQQLPDETSRLHGLVLPDDESRVYQPGEMPPNNSVMPSPDYPGTLRAVFRKKPWGQSGDWQEITEYIELSCTELHMLRICTHLPQSQPKSG